MSLPKLNDMTREELISLCREQRRLLAQGHERFKLCTTCGDLKPVNQFSIQAANPDGLQRKCKACSSLASKQWREKNVDKTLAKIAAQS